MAFISENTQEFGVEPICRVLTEHGVTIAPSTFYAALKRPVSARTLRDELELAELRRIHADPQLGRGLYGAPKRCGISSPATAGWTALRRLP